MSKSKAGEGADPQAKVGAVAAARPYEVLEQHAIIGNVEADHPHERTQHPDAQWFGNAGLGLFIHWGLSSVLGQYDLSWGMMKGPEGGIAKNVKVHGLPAVRANVTPAKYWEQARYFNPKHYDPGKWLKAAREAGFTYAVLTTRHHEGFALWPSEHGDFNTRNFMGGRDLLADYVQACRDNDIKVGFYYSPPDWHWNRDTMSFGRGQDTPLGLHHEPVVLPEFSAEEKADRASRYDAYIRGQVTELLTRYGKIDILWFDGSLPRKEDTISMEEIRALQPGILVNPRGHGYGDFKTPECRFPEQPYDETEWWELCYVFSDGAWGYLNHECYKPVGWLLSELSRVRAWGGNFLPNVGPDGNGELPHAFYQRMRELKAWMAHSGESVRNTRRGVWPDRCNVPVTRSESAWYLHIDWVWEGEVVLRDVERPAGMIYLRTGEEIPYVYEDRTVRFHFPEDSKTIETDVVKITWS